MKKNKPLLWLRSISSLADLSIIYSLAVLLQVLIWKFTFISFPLIFVSTFLLYYITSYRLLEGQTCAKLLTGLRIEKIGDQKLTLKAIMIRELILKGLIGLIIPAYFIEKIFPVWSSLFTVFSFVVVLVISILVLILFKKTWWEFLSKTYTVKVGTSSKESLKYTFLAITVIIISAILVNVLPFLIGIKDLKTSLPIAYPVTKETNRYADFVKQHAEDPVDYIFDQFKKHDIVVLSERMHPECTQYELIFKLVQDKRFIENVGNIFTECGSVSFQDTLTTYLHSHFTNEDSLNKSTAMLQRNSNGVWPLWDNTNLFDFFKRVNNLNNALPDSTKINWYFTDLAVNWQTMNHQKFEAGYTNPGRDSIMAAHIMEKYDHIILSQKRKKALVIMNTRHGYGLINSGNRKIRSENDNTTAYLMKEYPGKVSNIMLNTVSLKYGFLFTPVQNGKWETTFSSLDNPDVGFDFAGSPFGNDQFDLAFFNFPAITYKDVFTGFIFYKPLAQHFEKNGFPYEFDHFEDTILRRASYVSNEHMENYKRAIESLKQNPADIIYTRPINYGFLYNLVNTVAISVLLLLCYLTSLVFFVKQMRKT